MIMLISEHDARTICDLEEVCQNEGIESNAENLLWRISETFPNLKVEFSHLRWPEAADR